MEIKVVGPGCERCQKTEKRIQEIIEETGIDATRRKSHRCDGDCALRHFSNTSRCY